MNMYGKWSPQNNENSKAGLYLIFNCYQNKNHIYTADSDNLKRYKQKSIHFINMYVHKSIFKKWTAHYNVCNKGHLWFLKLDFRTKSFLQ